MKDSYGQAVKQDLSDKEERLDDEVERLLQSLFSGASVGFVAASLDLEEDVARRALESLVLDKRIISAPFRDGGGIVTRLYRAAEARVEDEQRG